MIVLDTSALIRFFTRDDESKADKVKRLLESDRELLLIDAVMMELVFTLSKVYSLPKNKIGEIVQFLFSRQNISINSELRRAGTLYVENNLSITDCLVVAHGEGNSIASFDDKLLKMNGVRPVFK